MGLIKKRGVETIDYTLLQKRGFIKKPEEKKNAFKVDSSGMIDLTGNAAISTDNNQANANINSNPFGFLDSLAQGSSNVSASPSLNNDNPEISALKIKIDDLEYKLSQLIEKLSKVESKLGNFENKVL